VLFECFLSRSDWIIRPSEADIGKLTESHLIGTIPKKVRTEMFGEVLGQAKKGSKDM
jgi:hypothetical protein